MRYICSISSSIIISFFSSLFLVSSSFLFFFLFFFVSPSFVFGQTFNVPAGSWATGIILTGISVALPGVVVDPGPVVVRIEEGFFTSADGIVDMSGCYAHGTAYWADHISRVVVEIKEISCPQGDRVFKLETLGYLYDEEGGFGFEADITPIEKEIWGVRIRTGIATVYSFTRCILFLREGFTFWREQKLPPGWRRPLTFPEDFKDFPP